MCCETLAWLREPRSDSRLRVLRLSLIDTMNLCVSTRPKPDGEQILKAAAASGLHGSGSRTASRIMAALCDPAVSAGQVAALLTGEPALCARVLRVANSAYYGESRSVTTIERALALLGLTAVRGIAAAACLDRALPRSSEHASVDIGGLLNHCHATALAADSLARIRHVGLSSDAFIGGLLHNLGIVLQIQLDAPGVCAMIELRRSGDTRDTRALELECSAIGHEECIAVVFEAWRLPESLVAAARHHHDPQGAPEQHRELAALINLGATLGLEAGTTFALEPAAGARNARAMADLGLDHEQVDRVAVALPGRLAEFRQAMLQG